MHSGGAGPDWLVPWCFLRWKESLRESCRMAIDYIKRVVCIKCRDEIR